MRESAFFAAHYCDPVFRLIAEHFGIAGGRHMSKFQRSPSEPFRRACERRIASAPTPGRGPSFFINMTEKEKTVVVTQTPKGMSPASEALRQKD